MTRAATPDRLRLPAGTAVPTVGVEEEFLLLRPDGRAALLAPDVLAAVGPEVRGAPSSSTTRGTGRS